MVATRFSTGTNNLLQTSPVTMKVRFISSSIGEALMAAPMKKSQMSIRARILKIHFFKIVIGKV
eukprot:5004224-Ditylum_brightwellii.AAC.1